MSQTWHLPLVGTDTLSDSRTYLNDAFEALRTMFSGASAPGTPVAGQLHFDTDDKVIYVYNGTSWVVVGDADLDNLGLLPKSGGSGAAMTGALYMGSQQLKNMANPTASTDGVNVAYADATYLKLAGGTMAGAIAMGANKLTSSRSVPDDDTEFIRKDYADAKLAKAGGAMTGDLAMGANDITGLPSQSGSTPGDYAASCAYLRGYFDTGSSGHDHDGSDSRKVAATNLDTTGHNNGMFVTSNASGAQMLLPWAVSYVAALTDRASYTDLCEVSIYVPRTTTYVYVDFSVSIITTSDVVFDVRLQDGSDTVITTRTGIANGRFKYHWCPGVAGTLTVTLQIQSSYHIDTGCSNAAMWVSTIG